MSLVPVTNGALLKAILLGGSLTGCLFGFCGVQIRLHIVIQSMIVLTGPKYFAAVETIVVIKNKERYGKCNCIVNSEL